MVFTHLPANVFLILVPLMPTLPLALLFLMLRSALSQMDVPARTSYVMAVVTPARARRRRQRHRGAAQPCLGGEPGARRLAAVRSAFGWPLVICGG